MCKYNKNCRLTSCTCGLPFASKVDIIPVEGKSNYELYKAYNPQSTITEKEYVEEYTKGDTYIPVTTNNFFDI